uniref:CASP-like protein n=1 Tax=Triticum aestivum TaxID=4565 RepID=A0A077S488_WHEAT|nr:unnamed protein product [Triticum aestivum]
MKRVVGSLGTWSGMALRLSQCVFAAASVLAMVSGIGTRFPNHGAYLYYSLLPTTNLIPPANANSFFPRMSPLFVFFLANPSASLKYVAI